MRLVVQRVTDASVSVGGETVGEIGLGLMVLVGVTHEDTSEDAAYLAEKLVNLRIFEDEGEKMNLSLLDVGAPFYRFLSLPCTATRKGRRPNFTKAAKPDQALQLYEEWNSMLRAKASLSKREDLEK